MSDQHETVGSAEPVPSRPQIDGYGIPDNAEGMMRWSDVVAKLETAPNYWIATVTPTGRPNAVPVWAAWIDGALYFSMGSGARTARNLAANSAASVHLENGNDVVILDGNVEVVHDLDPARSAPLDDAFATKYNWRPSVEMSGVPVGEGFFVLRPRTAVTWTSFPGDVTRWTFSDRSAANSD